MLYASVEKSVYYPFHLSLKIRILWLSFMLKSISLVVLVFHYFKAFFCSTNTLWLPLQFQRLIFLRPAFTLSPVLRPKMALFSIFSVLFVHRSSGVVRRTFQPIVVAVLYFSISLRKPFGEVCRPPIQTPPSTSSATR